MGKQKENNHFISRFQLKHFLCAPPPKKPGKNYVWVYDAKRAPEPRNIRFVASSPNFYGEDDDILEDAFAKIEGRSGSIFKDILANPTGISRHSKELGDLFWILAFRTRSMRERIRGSVTSAISLMAETASSKLARTRYKEAIDERLEKEISKELSGLNVFDRLRVKNSAEFQSRLRFVRTQIEGALTSGVFDDVMRTGFERTARFLENTTALDEGHNEGLRGFLDSGGQCPDSIRPAHWHVIPSDERNFVLSDAGTFAVTSSGSICPLIGISSDWNEVYLPISPSMTVVGARHSDRPKLNVTEIVTGSISTSYEEFYAEVYSQQLGERASKEINTANELIGSTALKGVVAGAWGRRGSELT
ncbi:DUF4238 domain-containing protein [Mesorhizobium sp. M0106]|uniref:DUF4238 domain-containing protein n=1 Tax=Mesorhizobium sp. M0106 TaxID=2956880 RepID=UPI00333DFC61